MKRSTKKMLKKVIPLGVIVLLVAVLYVTCALRREAETEYQTIPGTENDPRYGGVLNYPHWLSDSIDPHNAGGWGEYIWAACVFDNPLTIDPAGNLMPGACDYWLSEDNLTLVLWPRNGIVFHDGSEVTPQDIDASIRRASSLVSQVRTSFGKAVDWDNVQFIDFTDEDGQTHAAVKYTFKKYSVVATYYIACGQSWCAVLPARICEKYGKNQLTETGDLIGTGPYYVESYEPHLKLSLRRFGDYKICDEYYKGIERKGISAPRRAFLDEINFYESEELSLGEAMSFLNHDYDIGGLFGEFLTDYERLGIEREAADINMHYIAFNTKGHRPVNNVYLRKAIASAIDYSDYMQYQAQSGLFDVDDKENSFMDKATPYYDNRLYDADYAGRANVELAKKYLKKAYETGYNGEPVYILAQPDNEHAVLVQSMVEQIGIPVEVTFLEGASYEELRRNPDAVFDMVILRSVQGIYSPCQLVANVKSYYWGSAEKDALLEKIEESPYAGEESMKAWDKLMQLWKDTCPIIVVGAERQYIFFNSDLNRNIEGSWEYNWNSYWNHPENHK